MKRLAILFIFITSPIFGQNNPMFDSLDYYHRNKIKSIHFHLSSWYYSPGWKYLKFSFDKKNNTLTCDSMVYYDPSSPTAKKVKSLGTRKFSMRDTVYHKKGFSNSSRIKHQFDKNGRLMKKIEITEFDAPSMKNPTTSGALKGAKNFTSTTTYIYADASSKKLLRTVTESPYILEERNYFYESQLLVKRIDTKTNKSTRDKSVDTFIYEYYPDKKLKKEIRRVKDGQCKSGCEGSIEYTYDTD